MEKAISGPESSSEESASPREASSGVPSRTLEKGLLLLSLFDVDHPEWTLRELREETGFTKATTRRLIRTLEASKWVGCDPDTGKCHLGSRFLRTLFLATSYSELARLARPFLHRLAEETTESTSLTVWTDEGALIIDTVVTSRHFKPRTYAGMLLPGLASADAQVLVAFGSEEAWDVLLAAPIERRTPKTIVDPVLMRERLREVKRAGVALDRGEWKTEAPAVAAPVFDQSGQLRGSLSVVAPAERGSDAEMLKYATAVTRAAADLSRELGYDVSRSQGLAGSPDSKG